MITFNVHVENDKGEPLFVAIGIPAQTKHEAIEKLKSNMVFSAVHRSTLADHLREAILNSMKDKDASGEEGPQPLADAKPAKTTCRKRTTTKAK